MRALLLAAHGDGDGSESNLWALELAARTARLGGFSKAVVGFQKGTPAFSEVLEEVSEEDSPPRAAKHHKYHKKQPPPQPQF